MKTYLSQLTAIRAFHSVAKQGGIASAASELNVTAGAVRHQIRRLEEELDSQLVVRSRRGFSLTLSGNALYEKLSHAFEEIQNACRTTTQNKLEGELRIACAPALSALRLMAVLERFSERFPLVAVRLFPIEQADETMDVVISYGERPVQGSRYAILKNEQYFAVCSPDLFYRHELKSIADLASHVFLHSDNGEDWHRLCSAGGQAQLSPRQHIYLPNAYLALQAARESCGVAVGSSVLCSEDLRRGTLVKVINIEIPAPYPYFVIKPREMNRAVADIFALILAEQLDFSVSPE